MTQIRQYIGGEYVNAASGETFTSVNPATGEILAEVQIASRSDMDKAVESARNGQKSWAAKTGAERGRILTRAVELLRKRNDELAVLEVKDTGKPLQEANCVDIHTGADVIEYYAGLAGKIEGSYQDLGDGNFGLYSGDGNADGIISIDDIQDIWIPQFLNSSDGYQQGDFDMDGSVTASDNNMHWLPNSGKSIAFPN